MNDVTALALAIARDLEPNYGDGLVEHVEAALSGGVRSGHSRHMTDWSAVGSITDVSSLLVSMVGTAIAYVSLQRATSENTALQISHADISALDRALDDAIADLGMDQQATAKKLKGEVCEWLERRGQR